MTLEEFIKILDKDNPQYEELTHSISQIKQDGYLCELLRKDKNLLDTVRNLINRGLFPVVDKKLAVVFGLRRAHDFLCAELYRYHAAAASPTNPYTFTRRAAELYISKGMGWFISSMNPSCIVATTTYWQDKFDKDIFPFFDHD